MSMDRKFCAVVPVKELAQAKQRLAGVLPPSARRGLALAMLEDVLAALAATPGLAGILMITVDDAAAAVGRRFGATISASGAREGHTGAIEAAAAHLASQNLGMVALPGDIPLVQWSDIHRLISAHGEMPAFSIVPARDEQGSNAVLCAPANAVPLRFGPNSFYPHLAAALELRVTPRVLRLPRIELDIDTPDDLAQLRARQPRGRTQKWLEEWDAVTTPRRAAAPRQLGRAR
jgi:2-phospho-L-lactate guanylyltransferase